VTTAVAEAAATRRSTAANAAHINAIERSLDLLIIEGLVFTSRPCGSRHGTARGGKREQLVLRWQLLTTGEWFCDAAPPALCFGGWFLGNARRLAGLLPWRHEEPMVHLDASNGQWVWQLADGREECGGRLGRWPD
jgi:hypothetical protein